MSENDDSKGSKDKRNQICRDFLRNVCMRQDCKYFHPDDKDVYIPTARSTMLTFCHDFQNGKCTRFPCKFLHCTDQEEEIYMQTGELPARVLEEPCHKWVVAELMTSKFGDKTPLCRDYLSSVCSRRPCRFRHVSIRELESMNKRSKDPFRNSPEDDGLLIYRHDNRSVDEYEPYIKRRRFMEAAYAPSYQNGQLRSDRAMLMLEEENAILRQRIGELKKRVDDLQATNEFLLEQNAQMRINDKGAASLTAVTVPAVTITNTGQMQPAQASNHQVMNAAIRTVTASVATVPVSIAAVAGTPCSIATVSMAPVQIPPAVVTMAQPSGQNPTAGPQALPMSISEAPGPLVSYPLMTRPVLQPNITH